MNKWKTLSVILLAILLITITFFAVNKEKVKIQEKGPEKIYIGHNEKISDNAYKEIITSIEKLEKEVVDESTKTKLSEILKSAEGEQVILTNFNKESAVNELQSLFLSIGKDLGQTSIENDTKDKEETEGIKEYTDNISKKLALLDNKETDIEDIFNKEIIDKLYFAEEFREDKFNRQFASSALLIYYDILVGNDNTTITPIIEIYDEIVYLDSRFMTAHIPLDLFVGSSTGIAFEMQYVDGQWKLNPYTSMMSLNLMSILNNTPIE